MRTTIRTVLFGMCLGVCLFSLSCRTNRAASKADLPRFYDQNNLAEYYGRCPKCNEWATAYWTIRHYSNDKGENRADHRYRGECKRCRVALVSDETFSGTNDLRIIHFKLRE